MLLPFPIKKQEDLATETQDITPPRPRPPPPPLPALSAKSSRGSFITQFTQQSNESAQHDGDDEEYLEQDTLTGLTATTSLDTNADLTSSSTSRLRRASTSLLSQDGDQLQTILGHEETGTTLIQKFCCGGGCCFSKLAEHNTKSNSSSSLSAIESPVAFPIPTNDAFKSLNINLGSLAIDSQLTSIIPLPEKTVSFASLASISMSIARDTSQPPAFVQPHPPYNIFSAPIVHARELTKPGAEKRTFHFDIDVTDYPDEGGVDFKVGGAIGICPPNDESVVNDILDRLGVPNLVRDKPILLCTSGGRWPTIWGNEQAREVVTTRRELLTWCSDLQSTPPTKPLLRILAEHTSDVYEAKILNYLLSAEGQTAFCDLRTGPHLTLSQLLHAFPLSHPPLDSILSVLKQLMPRFYSLSNDPCVSFEMARRRLIEIAVTIHETADYKLGTRTGTGSGYLLRTAQKFMESHQVAVPLFRGLMANPLTREFTTDGPMLLIGAGVGMAPFRGYILNRLKNANCANKIWLLQGIRDTTVDELYHGELGLYEKQVKRVVQSRNRDKSEGEAKYVQEEVLHQSDIVWFVINAVDGRVCVCGSSQGMGQGVWDALVRVVMQKGRMNRDEAERFWKSKEESGQYIAELWD